MSRPHILQIGPLDSACPGADELLKARYDVLELWKEDNLQTCLNKAKDISVIVCSVATGCDSAIIRSLPKLKLVCNMGVGYDRIDLDVLRERNITLTNTPDVPSDCVADAAWGLLIACARRIAQGDRFVRANAWGHGKGSFPLGTRVSGKKLGIVGMGRIGMAIARRATGFDMEIGYHDVTTRQDVTYKHMQDLTELARWSDFLVISTPGGKKTEHLIDHHVLKALGPTGIVVNIARGSVIDEAAMVQLLTSGELGGAGLDVFEHEPDVPSILKQMDQVVLAPHSASATIETRKAMTDLMLENLEAYFSGKPLLTPVALD